MIKNIKSRDTYGQIVDRVKNMKMMKAQNENDNPDPPPPGGKFSLFHFSRKNNFFKKIFN